MYLKSVENVITLGKLIGLLFLFCLPLLSILFLKTKRNDLARLVMGTIFLVYIGQFYLQISLEEFWSIIQIFDCPRKTSTGITCNYKPQTTNKKYIY